jgi:hypothetical protein
MDAKMEVAHEHVLSEAAHGGCAEALSTFRGDERFFGCLFITNHMLMRMVTLRLFQPDGE